jgi:hypothetical protein
MPNDIYTRMNTPKTTKFTLKRIVENLGKIPEKGFGEEKKRLTSDQKRKLMQMTSMFENFGQCLRNEEALLNSAKGLTELCELAETYAVHECGDWFQQEIVMKDMKALKQRLTEFQKIAKEGYARMQQLGVTYEDMRHILGRYYNLKQDSFQQPNAASQPKRQTLEKNGENNTSNDYSPRKCKCGRTFVPSHGEFSRCSQCLGNELTAADKYYSDTYDGANPST